MSKEPLVSSNMVGNTSDVEENKYVNGIKFQLNKDVIGDKSFNYLDKAVEIIKTFGSQERFIVVGATDSRGSAIFNKNLSQSRADIVVKYLVNKGVPTSVLTAEGREKEDLKYVECDPATKCLEWKNEANRRVYFVAR
ncbi:OmpA family protein [Epilithonimonas sp.]|uniref:OmpA family protein n=1 Tax=Epilithonimonas sp. TaxID=2894511 RepID=UPI00289F46E7|nr:OmpA family protein [Epilithonimonas sp.]